MAGNYAEMCVLSLNLALVRMINILPLMSGSVGYANEFMLVSVYWWVLNAMATPAWEQPVLLLASPASYTLKLFTM